MPKNINRRSVVSLFIVLTFIVGTLGFGTSAHAAGAVLYDVSIGETTTSGGGVATTTETVRVFVDDAYYGVVLSGAGIEVSSLSPFSAYPGVYAAGSMTVDSTLKGDSKVSTTGGGFGIAAANTFPIGTLPNANAVNAIMFPRGVNTDVLIKSGTDSIRLYGDLNDVAVVMKGTSLTASSSQPFTVLEGIYKAGSLTVGNIPYPASSPYGAANFTLAIGPMPKTNTNAIVFPLGGTTSSGFGSGGASGGAVTGPCYKTRSGIVAHPEHPGFGNQDITLRDGQTFRYLGMSGGKFWIDFNGARYFVDNIAYLNPADEALCSGTVPTGGVSTGGGSSICPGNPRADCWMFNVTPGQSVSAGAQAKAMYSYAGGDHHRLSVFYIAPGSSATCDADGANLCAVFGDFPSLAPVQSGDAGKGFTTH